MYALNLKRFLVETNCCLQVERDEISLIRLLQRNQCHSSLI